MSASDHRQSALFQGSPAAELLAATDPAPVVVGTGLLALDVIHGLEAGSSRAVAAGGTCGNVLTGLAYLGWEAYPVGRLAADGAGDRVRADLGRWRVNLDFASLTPTSSTPVIVQRITRDAKGHVSHKFSLSCEECGRWLPTYAPVPAATMVQAFTTLPVPDVCFIDRASPGAAVLAEWAADSGALVYAEPSGRSTPAQLARLIAAAHVVKYSAYHRVLVVEAKRLAGRAFDPWLEVETQGATGLRYRTRGAKGWRSSPSIRVSHVRDTAGAGDWFSVGLLHLIGQGGAAAMQHLPTDLIHEAVCVGQALGAWTCQYEGARGGMYGTSRSELSASVERLLRRETANGVPETDVVPTLAIAARVALCRDCTEEALVG